MIFPYLFSEDQTRGNYEYSSQALANLGKFIVMPSDVERIFINLQKPVTYKFVKLWTDVTEFIMITETFQAKVADKEIVEMINDIRWGRHEGFGRVPIDKIREQRPQGCSSGELVSTARLLIYLINFSLERSIGYFSKDLVCVLLGLMELLRSEKTARKMVVLQKTKPMLRW